MNLFDAVAVFAAGIAAGGINTVVGSGSLITFPTMVALGFPPVTANVSNNIGLVPGSVTGAYGYRDKLRGQRTRLLRLGAASVLGAALGSLLLLELPASAFDVIVPVLIVIALVLVIVQPRLQAYLRARERRQREHGGPGLWAGVFGAGVYGGYFGAAQGIVLIGLLGTALKEDLQRVNAAKNVLSALVNGTAAVVFISSWAIGRTGINWLAVLLIAAGSTIGGLLGAKVGQRIPSNVLRGVIVLVGLVALWRFLF
ncbi:sulfite exporter TauE/SafE family protein [Actinomadura logoneensis]|uniref:Probable membrane transporter protein n=1 Tax=Actinomadura logoneensis TaxID=2293572 RepID=A0A372JQF3_9ACTN|nr:sulfite exporter TauE/SafE family protein [Actinomadura logoneensis]RFU42179.1 sulfite exporter TauE/SafE family protein [Actinomadura logoneensis]